MFKINSSLSLMMLFFSVIFLSWLAQAKHDKTRFVSLAKKQTEQVCIDSFAGDFECKNIDLFAHMPLDDFSSSPNTANDIWGHVDLNNGNEYAIIGLSNGVAVINVSDPSNPTEVGVLSGKTDIWRDIKVYQYFDETLNLWRAYAYVTTDGSVDYLTVISLNNLPNSISLEQKNKVITTAHNVYISNVDHTLNIALPGIAPTLQLMGANTFSGAFHSYSLASPENISLLSSQSAGSGYSHDGASLTITDERKSTDCQTTADACSVFIDFNEKELKLWDITDASTAKLLSTIEYNDVSKANIYVHSGWASEDKQYIFVHDEFDEYKGGLNSTLRIFSISDLTNPQQVGQWTGSTRAIDHNGFVRGNRYYMANYERGLTVLDITDPTVPTEIGYFDTYTSSNNADFNGVWGVYPFLPSGNILISDINGGLYVLKDNTLASEQGQLSFLQTSKIAVQGEVFELMVQRTGSSDSATTVDVAYEILSGSATEQSDYTASAGVLSWSSNDVSPQRISIAIAEDPSSEEFSESFYVRLYNPTNGATIAAPSYITVNIAGKINNIAPVVNVVADFEVNVGQSVTLTSTVTDAENDELSYLWQQDSGETVTLNDSDKLSANFVAPLAAGSLSFTLTATDSKGDVGSDTVIINVSKDSDPESVVESLTKKSSGGSQGVLVLLLASLFLLKVLGLKKGRGRMLQICKNKIKHYSK